MPSKYEKLSGDESKFPEMRFKDSEDSISFPEYQQQENSLNSERRGVLQRLLLFAFMVLLSNFCFILGWVSHRHDENAGLDTAWKKLREAVRFTTLEFDPRFEGPESPYMGNPTPELDKLWYDLSVLPNFAVDRTTLSKINRTLGAVQYPGTDLYQVGLEAYHQLHCLNYVRMYTHQDYYGKFDYDMIAESPEERRKHKDHCIEELRQELMCRPDLNIYTYHWIKNADKPYGNLFTRHRCVDWDALNAWAMNHVATYSSGDKPPNAEILH